MKKNCQAAFKSLYDYLNSDIEKLDSAKIEENLALCRSVCDYCKFSKEVTNAMQTSCFRKKASAGLKNKISMELGLSG